jgi:Fe-S cluster assembly protein SufD
MMAVITDVGQVNKLAQKTDAQQLSRNLLMVPRATVNVKPNLQIIADDVKCTHGCSVSDLREDELFYFRFVYEML